MQKKILATIIILLLSSGIAFAQEHDFEKTKQLIESEISCANLSDEQLEAIGDYYMEQMHPGKAHEFMDQMMGGEGSESLRQVHINMAKRLYCNENLYVGYGVSGPAMMGSGGMMGPWMMNNWNQQNQWIGTDFGYWNIQSILYTALLIGLIALVFLWAIKTWKTIPKSDKQ